MTSYEPTLAEFPLTESQRTRLSECQRILLLGKPGTGKTTVGELCLKDHQVLRIDSYHLKQWAEIQEKISLHRKTRNVLRMFQCPSSPDTPGILIDTLETFYRYDKKSYGWFEGLFRESVVTLPMKVVLVAEDSLRNLRSLTRILKTPGHASFTLQYSGLEYLACVRRLCDASPFAWTSQEIRQVAKASDRTFRKAQEWIARGPRASGTASGMASGTSQTFDDDFTGQITFSETSERLRDILRHPYSISETLRLSEACETLQLNALDHVCPLLVRYPRAMYEIYRGYIEADLMDRYVVSHQAWHLSPYVDLGGFGVLATWFRECSKTPLSLPKNIPHHSYLSKTLLHLKGVRKRNRRIPECTLYDDLSRYHVEGRPLPDATLAEIADMDLPERRQLTQMFALVYRIQLTLP